MSDAPTLFDAPTEPKPVRLPLQRFRILAPRSGATIIVCRRATQEEADEVAAGYAKVYGRGTVAEPDRRGMEG